MTRTGRRSWSNSPKHDGRLGPSETEEQRAHRAYQMYLGQLDLIAEVLQRGQISHDEAEELRLKCLRGQS